MTEDKQPNNGSQTISTGGGAVIPGVVKTGGGDFVGRDKIINIYIHNIREIFLLLILVLSIYLISPEHQTKDENPTLKYIAPTAIPLPMNTALPPVNTPTSKSSSNFEITLTALENQQNTTPVPLQPLPTPINTTLLPIEMTLTALENQQNTTPVPLPQLPTLTIAALAPIEMTLTALTNIQNTPAPNTPEPPTNTNTPLPPIKTPTLIPISTETVIPANTATSTTAPTVEATATIDHTPPPNTPEQPTATQVTTSAYILRLFDKTNGNSATDFQVDMVNTSCGLANIVGPGIFLLDETDLVQQVTNLKSGFKGAGLPEFLDLLKVYNDDAKVIGFLASSSEQLIVIQDKNLRLYLIEETVQQIPSLADLPITQNQEVMCIGDVNEVRSFQFILQALVGQYQLLLIQN